MKGNEMVKIHFLSLLFVFVFSACSTTTLPFSQASENAWFLESGGGVNAPIYCWANKKDDGQYYPRCRTAAKDQTLIVK